ncbi:MAG: anhydro-N-acetylmuramic acid kinase [Alphaproteobacteria bacterium]|nr:anhydro-N-acetylmuramic acid kinase [Alphaproteobacteria bacterium]
MQLLEKKFLALYSDTALQEVEVAFVSTDGLDISKVDSSFSRPYSYDLKDKLLNITSEQLADRKAIDALDKEVTNFFIEILKEAKESFPQKADYITVMGPIIKNSTDDKYAIELGNFETMANYFQIPVIGHFMQTDLMAGGTGSPLKAVFWETMARKIEKPVVIANIGGILKLIYLGVNGEIIGFDAGIGLSLMDEWVFRRTGQSQDDDGWLSAQGKADKKVVKALLKHPFLSQNPPKAVEPEDFDSLLGQLEGLSPADGCATLVSFFVETLKKAEQFLPEKAFAWILTGGGLKNPSLTLALRQAFNIQKASDCFAFHEHLNAIGIAFLGARHLVNLPISLPTTTGVAEAISGGEVFDPAPDK